MATKRKKAAGGRPPAVNPLDVRISFRVTASENQAIEQAAAADQRPVAQWIRIAVVQAAEHANGSTE